MAPSLRTTTNAERHPAAAPPSRGDDSLDEQQEQRKEKANFLAGFPHQDVQKQVV
eukprot:CAMPEP_0113694808 /NCGR_PEP_ID=MMETSP0038_2-20120614/20515_1 /TAXON_ID=2898 /ORGANISM="Cryptomonas paramecium" /LENGTH=54 /DNA_ID=CAMNT_0000617211 /DNA_START=135 /DNA_END=300 /DNA_ORIENTATION=- /assembly_acc=CAM_ASM_000170